MLFYAVRYTFVKTHFFLFSCIFFHVKCERNCKWLKWKWFCKSKAICNTYYLSNEVHQIAKCQSSSKAQMPLISLSLSLSLSKIVYHELVNSRIKSTWSFIQLLQTWRTFSFRLCLPLITRKGTSWNRHLLGLIIAYLIPIHFNAIINYHESTTNILNPI